LKGLPYKKPTLGRDYWLADDFLPDALEVRKRCLERKDWTLGFPYRDEGWPGMRALPALLPDELALVDAWVKEKTGVKRLWQNPDRPGTLVNHNCVQVVGGNEAEARPHTDSRSNCRFAGVLYLTPQLPADCGTSFFRQRLPNGTLGGNQVPPPHDTLAHALGQRFLPPGSFIEDVRIDYRFNRLVIYRADLIHSATRYFGRRPEERRMAAVFFWHGQ
jgi:hypothetical protein